MIQSLLILTIPTNSISRIIKKVDYSDVDSTTTLTINDASVMTTSVNSIKIIYDEISETWDWDGNVAPTEYSTAKIYGDATQCYIDLDNSWQ